MQPSKTLRSLAGLWPGTPNHFVVGRGDSRAQRRSMLGPTPRRGPLGSQPLGGLTQRTSQPASISRARTHEASLAHPPLRTARWRGSRPPAAAGRRGEAWAGWRLGAGLPCCGGRLADADVLCASRQRRDEHVRGATAWVECKITRPLNPTAVHTAAI